MNFMLMNLLECTHSTAEKKTGRSAPVFPECDFFRRDYLETQELIHSKSLTIVIAFL